MEAHSTHIPVIWLWAFALTVTSSRRIPTCFPSVYAHYFKFFKAVLLYQKSQASAMMKKSIPLFMSDPLNMIEAYGILNPELLFCVHWK